MTTNALIATHKNWLTPSTDIDQYIAKVRQIPALDAEEERKLAIALQETNDINAAQTLIVHHLKFVVHIARGFTGYGLPLGDLIQEVVDLVQVVALFHGCGRFETSVQNIGFSEQRHVCHSPL